MNFGGERMEFHLSDPSPACIARLGCSCKVQISLFQWGTGGKGRLDATGESSNGRKPAFTQSLAPEEHPNEELDLTWIMCPLKATGPPEKCIYEIYEFAIKRYLGTFLLGPFHFPSLFLRWENQTLRRFFVVKARAEDSLLKRAVEETANVSPCII